MVRDWVICRLQARGRARLALLALALLLAVTSTAAADFQPVPAPPGGIRDLAVADGFRWAAVSRADGSLRVTANAGANWTPVPLQGNFPVLRSVGAAADGSFRVVVGSWEGSDPVTQVYKVTAAGESTPVGPAFSAFSFLPSLVEDDGTTWLLTNDPYALAIVHPDGSATNVALPGVDCMPCPGVVRTALGPRVAVDNRLFRLDGSALLPAEAQVVELIDGDLWLGPGVISWDAGQHWAQVGEDGYGGVIPRAPGGGAARLLQTYEALASRIAVRYSASLYRATALTVPRSDGPYATVVDAGDRLVAWTESGIWVHDGPLPPFPSSTGPLEVDTRAMVDRANIFRADAGLPPIVGDPLLSQAARNHSRYTTLNDPDDEFSPHEETPGKPGFTGDEPWDRCRAAGTVCDSEVMFSEGEDDPVGGWLATSFHRFVPGNPKAGLVGAGQVPDGWAVMDGGAKLNVQVDAIGYPIGRWRGDPGFVGEVPDPVEECGGRQPIAYPIGIAVSLYAPSTDTGGQPTIVRITVNRRSDRRALAGCLLTGLDGSGQFVLDDPLVPGETYDAEGEWRAGTEQIRTLRWSFTYTPEASVHESGGRSRGHQRTPRRRCMSRVATLVASRSATVVRGTRRRDVVIAGPGAQRIRTGAGNDFVCAGGGRDRVEPGLGHDRVAAGPGADRVLIVDATRDRVDCGGGRDRVVADRIDAVMNCERVRRVRSR